ncbi:TPA: 50S ribosomal protein L5 [archaeon]|uniref:Large ribosomal subunit protein uL5 n=1 Tax=Candidatus Naiadarchaeum limnaeum TaxID=2756139 RepID=A0A832UNK9_9ARCH|nr:50S ribosomal protein L5 [Candidatus Naiadarchaeales archaeon SRR2090153.bin1042]HIK00494.1 50S ribosomal protein L5 [Candidatus Naiadarchaeum limnaeum]
MNSIRINKVSLNIGVGDSGEKLQKAERLLRELTGQKPVRTYGKKTISEWNVKKFAPIGVKVTLRGENAKKFLERAFVAVENIVRQEQFDSQGNLSFGVKEYIELPGAKYDPDVGMFGFDVNVNLDRMGYRIARRKYAKRKIPSKLRISQEEAKKFFEENFKVKVQSEA